MKKPEKILIVGGGTAGWMAANLLMARWSDIDVCLLESSDIGIIGVGEGSTPHLKLFFDEVGIEESEWMPRCNATYKNGIYFSQWSSVPGYSDYFHPFPAQVDDLTVPLFFQNIQARMNGVDAKSHPDNFFLESYLTNNGLAPLAAECFPFSIGYGYHFDSGLLGQFLAEKAIAKGLKRIVGNLTEVVLKSDGSIESVRLDDDSFLEADFFIDCTGFRSLLLQGALKVSFNSYKENLFNNSAVVMPTEISKTIIPATKSTALTNGWAWKIPLTNRYGNGYVYSDDYLSANDAETELRQHLGLLDSDIQTRHLKMKVGRAEKHWEKNCLAVGLSQGFIEPLEATALALTYTTVAQFMAFYEQGNFSHRYEDVFNESINIRFEGVRDYIVCHYKVNQRLDTQYWCDNAENSHLSDNLNAILKLWWASDNFALDMRQKKLEVSYQAKSWACLLAGYGCFPSLRSSTPDDVRVRASTPGELAQLADFIRRCGLNFKKHDDVIFRGASQRG